MSHGIEYRLLIGKQVLGRVEFRHDALIQHQNSVRIHHSVDSVRNGQNRTVGKLASDGALDNSIRLNINSSRGFIEDQNGRLAKKSTGKANKLSRKLPMVTKRRKSYLFFFVLPDAGQLKSFRLLPGQLRSVYHPCWKHGP